MRNVILILSSLAIGAGVLMAADAKVDLTKIPAAASKKGLTYAKDIKPLFEGSCFGCHGPEKQKGKLRFDSLEATLKGGGDGKVLEAEQERQEPPSGRHRAG